MAEPLKATFFAFKRRERGGVLTGATVTHLVLFLLTGVPVGGPALVLAVTPSSEPTAGASSAVAALAAIAWSFIYALIMASYEAACLRWLLRGETSGWAGFSLGGATWRVYVGYWIWFGIGLLAYIGTALVFLLIAQAMRYSMDGSSVVTVYSLLGLWLLALAPFALRLSAGNAVSVARRKLSYFRAWTLSRGRGGAIFGSFALLWLIWAIVFVVLMLGFMVAGYFIVGGENGAPPATINITFSIASIAALLVVNMFMTLLSAGVNARIALAAAAEGKLDGLTTNVADVFT